MQRFFAVVNGKTGHMLSAFSGRGGDGPALFNSAKAAKAALYEDGDWRVVPVVVGEMWAAKEPQPGGPRTSKPVTSGGPSSRYSVAFGSRWFCPSVGKDALLTDFGRAYLFNSKDDAIAVTGLFDRPEVHLVRCVDSGVVWTPKKA